MRKRNPVVLIALRLTVLRINLDLRIRTSQSFIAIQPIPGEGARITLTPKTEFQVLARSSKSALVLVDVYWYQVQL